MPVVLFYRYHRLSNPDAVAAREHELCESLNLRGRLLIAAEGVNGTLQGDEASLRRFEAGTSDGGPASDDWRAPGVDWKYSSASPSLVAGEKEEQELFPDLCVKRVREIVGWTLPRDVRPSESGYADGTHLTPEEFHAAVQEMLEQQQQPTKEEGQQEIVLFDVRNGFEFKVGHFDSARAPEGVRVTSQFPSFFEREIRENSLKDKKVLMYCTGGVRCEKVSVYLRSRGVKNVFQLQGGVHRYLEKFEDGGLFRGKNFVFDGRVSQPVGRPDEGDADRRGVGRCCECAADFDELSGGRLCTVCHDLVLVCDKCHYGSTDERYCAVHEELRGLYLTFLEPFTAEQLRDQLTGLRTRFADLSEGRQFKNVRATLRKQMTRLQTKIGQLESGDATPDLAWEAHCVMCHEPRSKCDGTCWGIWQRVHNQSHD
jgi:predicted sulfurtransferase